MARSIHFNGSRYKRMSDDCIWRASRRGHTSVTSGLVMQLADYCQLSPDEISEEELCEFCSCGEIAATPR